MQDGALSEETQADEWFPVLGRPLKVGKRQVYRQDHHNRDVAQW